MIGDPAADQFSLRRGRLVGALQHGELLAVARALFVEKVEARVIGRDRCRACFELAEVGRAGGDFAIEHIAPGLEFIAGGGECRAKFFAFAFVLGLQDRETILVGFEIHVLKPHEAFEIFDQRLQSLDATNRDLKPVLRHFDPFGCLVGLGCGARQQGIECGLCLTPCDEGRLEPFFHRFDFLVDRFFSLFGNAADPFEVRLVECRIALCQQHLALGQREIDLRGGIPFPEVFGSAFDIRRATCKEPRADPRCFELPLGGAIGGRIAIAHGKDRIAHGILGGFHLGDRASQQAFVVEQG